MSMAASDTARAMSNAERDVRVDLAACYRLVARFGWNQLIFSHLSARVPDTRYLLLNPFGLLFSEITASSLVKADIEGNIVGASDYPLNAAAPALHTPWYGEDFERRYAPARPVGCVMHLETDAGAAVSAQAGGLLPINQTTLGISHLVAYHDFEGFALDADESERLMADAGGDKKVLILRNHGTLILGPTVAATFQLAYLVEQACRAQLLAQSGGATLAVPSAAVQARAAGQQSTEIETNEAAWPSLLRLLDREDPSYHQ
jgi:ribulose-5-phosphate 4-epimerase/fuculose-1-phosphate aldolase